MVTRRTWAEGAFAKDGGFSFSPPAADCLGIGLYAVDVRHAEPYHVPARWPRAVWRFRARDDRIEEVT